MTEQFTAITIEIRGATESSWTDISADVLAEPALNWSIGITGGGLLSKVGGPDSLTFSLNNSEGNSQATRGYYTTPTATFGVGSFVRLGFTYDSITRYKWHGRIEPDGIDIIPGIKGARRVDVRCVGYMGQAAQTLAELLPVRYNQRIEQAVHYLAHEVMIYNPLRYEYDTGDTTFPYVFDLQNNAAAVGSEFAKLAQSELGYIYVRGDDTGGETLVVERRTRRFDIASAASFDIQNYLSIPKTAAESDLLLKMDGDQLLMVGGNSWALHSKNVPLYDDSDINEGMVYTRGSERYNYAKISVNPRRLDAANTTVLWTMESALLVAAGTTVSGLRGRYRDPNGAASYVNGVDMVWPVANTDFQAFANSDGTGTDFTADMSVSVTFGTAEVEFSITNTGGTDFYTGGPDITFQFRGRGVYKYDTVEIVKKSESGITGRGQHIQIHMDMEYQDDPNVGANFAETQLLKGNDSNLRSIPLLANRDTFNMQSFMFLEPGAMIGVTETMTNLDEDIYFVNGIEGEIVGKETVEYTLHVIDRDVLPIS